MASIDAVGTRSEPRAAPPLGFLWALGLALAHAAVVSTVTLWTLTYGGFLPELLVSGAVTGWIGELAGLLLLVAVLTYARWWGVTGLRRLAPRRDGWTVLPLLGLVVLGAVLGRLQYGQLLAFSGMGQAGPVDIVSYALLFGLFPVGAILLAYSLVPHLLGGRGGRSPVAVVVMTGVVIGLTTVVDNVVYVVGMPSTMSEGQLDAGDLLLAMLAQLLLAVPFVAVALRTGAPWLLLPVLLLRVVTVLPADPWFWAYVGLGAAYGLWLAVTTPATPGHDRTQVPGAT